MAKMIISYIIITLLVLVACSGEKPKTGPMELKHYALDNLNGLITQEGIEFDGTVSTDSFGSLKIMAAESTTVRLFETGDIDAEEAKLFYRAKVRTENLEGQAILEMWCTFADMGEYFARDLQTPVTGTTDWSSEEAFFILEKDQNPDNVKLNIVINGKGTVWVDDVRLIKAPLSM